VILELCYYNNPVLRQKAEPVAEITEEIRKLAANMVETVQAKRGIGLAAPQVGQSLRIVVLNLDDDDSPGKMMPGHPLVLINPVLSDPSLEVWTSPEGCLSIPGPYGEVERPVKIHCKALGIDGGTIDRDFIGWEARVLMHENDHINGVLFIDRMERKARKKLDSVLKDVDRRYNKR
jgi:peptide deformylase